MYCKPATPEAYELLHRGSLAFAQIERAGVRIDTDYLKRKIKEVETTVLNAEAEMRDTKPYQLWQRRFGTKMSLEAPAQLGTVFFDMMGYERNPFCKDEPNGKNAFKHIKEPFLKLYFLSKELKKAKTTYLKGILRETVDGYCRPQLGLGTAVSYRSNCRNPNFQNNPIRNKLLAEIVRSCVIPRGKDWKLMEADYGAQEVRIGYCYHEDPQMEHDIVGGGDMHTDMAMELFMLTRKQLGDIDNGSGKMVRYSSKNGFVFPSAYGSYYAQCAPNLWEMIEIFDLKRSDGVGLYEHLQSKGIHELGLCDPDLDPKPCSFEDHVRECERYYWNERYKVYNQWKKDWYSTYLEKGGFPSLTGFCYQGIFKRNQVLSYSIQGSAFHCLLWAICEIQEEFRLRGLWSKLICQIHDSLLLDVYKPEEEEVIAIIKKIALKRILDHYRWINIPLAMEFETSDENWFKKKKIAA